MTFTRSALKIAFYSLIAYATAYAGQLVDIYWVAQLGQGAPTAIAIVASLFYLIFSLNEVIGASTVPLFSQAYGSGNKQHTGHIILQSLLAKFTLGLLQAALFLTLLYTLLPHYTKDPTITNYIKQYAPLIWLSLPIVGTHATALTALRTIGQAAITAPIALIALLSNLILTPLLLFGYGPIPPLGIQGAALATILSELTALLIALTILKNNKAHIPIFTKQNLKPNKTLYKNLLLIGLPIGGVAALYNLEQTIITALIAQYPTAISDGYGIGARISGLLFMAIFGIGVGASITVGHNLGKGDLKAIKQGLPKFTLTATGLMSLITLPIALFATPLLSLITDHPTTIETAATYLRYMSISLLFFTAMICLEGAFSGAGKNLPVLAAFSAMYLLIEFPLLGLAHLLYTPTLHTLWSIILTATALGALTMATLYKRNYWHPTKNKTQSH